MESHEVSKIDDTSFSFKFFFKYYVPIRSHVCSFAVLSLWIMFAGGPAPLGTAVATAGEIALACAADPFDNPPGVVGMVELPLRWGGWFWGWDGWLTRLWGWGWTAGGGGGSCIRTSRSGWRGRCLWDMSWRGKGEGQGAGGGRKGAKGLIRVALLVYIYNIERGGRDQGPATGSPRTIMAIKVDERRDWIWFREV